MGIGHILGAGTVEVEGNDLIKRVGIFIPSLADPIMEPDWAARLGPIPSAETLDRLLYGMLAMKRHADDQADRHDDQYGCRHEHPQQAWNADGESVFGGHAFVGAQTCSSHRARIFHHRVTENAERNT